MSTRFASHASVIAALIVLAGCGAGGGSASGGLADGVATGTAPYVVLDLATRGITWHVTLPGGPGSAALRSSEIAFRRVRVGATESFVAVFELTQAQWATIAGAGPLPWAVVPDEVCDSAVAETGTRPAYNLDYETVITELAAFPLADGHSLRLPTASEWTAACGTESGWWWGDTASQAQIAANAAVREGINTTDASRLDAVGVDNKGPLPVGSRAPNALGIYDIHGNVWELVQGGTTARGGSWRDSAWQSRAESTLGSGELFHQELDYALVGARLVFVP